MSILVNCQSIEKEFGAKTLFRNLSFSVFSHQRLGIIGPNGSGKSTLLKILKGTEQPEKGSVILRKGLKVALASQSVKLETCKLHPHLANLFEFEKVSLDSTLDPELLSGGWKRRLIIAKAIEEEPELLLLDEPTNHLDLESIRWLEKFLVTLPMAMCIISHDRTFLDKVTNATLEINPRFPKGHFFVDGPYSTYLEKSKSYLEQEAKDRQSKEMELKKQLEWLGRTAPARTAKSSSRLQGVETLKEEVADLKERNRSKGEMATFSSNNVSAVRLVSIKNLDKAFEEKILFKGFNLEIQRKDRFVLVGGNGTGKTTLLRMIKGEIVPDLGTIKIKDGLKIVYFDQMKSTLPSFGITLHQGLVETMADTVQFQGRSLHITSLAKKFRFDPKELMRDISTLSGGERARMMICRLMQQPADLLLLDEPTNDLDIETVDLLIESLLEFEGALLLISHDRYFMNAIATTFIGLGKSHTQTLFADFSQFEEFKNGLETKAPSPSKTPISPSKKLFKRSTREIEKLIDLQEKQKSIMESKMLLLKDQELFSLCEEYKSLSHNLEQLYKKWEELEN